MSRSFALLPWECLFKIGTVVRVHDSRSFALAETSNTDRINGAVIFCPIKTTAEAAYETDLMDSIRMQHMSTVTLTERPRVMAEGQQLYPVSSPLIKVGRRATSYRTKYPMFKFIDYHLTPSAKLFESSTKYPIMLLTALDFYQCPIWLRMVIENGESMTLLFAPIPVIKIVALRLQEQLQGWSDSGTPSLRHKTSSSYFTPTNHIDSGTHSAKHRTISHVDVTNLQSHTSLRVFVQKCIRSIQQTLQVPLPYIEICPTEAITNK